ncbi:MAG: ATPase, partial [Runella sp.]
MNTQTLTVLLERIGEYKRKYYFNQLIKGVIFAVAFVLSAYLFVNTLEYFGRFSSTVRATLFFGFLGILGYALVRWVAVPLVHLYGLRKSLSDEDAASQIGAFFPEIGDKLLNTLQLRNLSGSQTDLIAASIEQKSKQLMIVRFADAIKIDQNRRYLKYAAWPLGIIAMVLLINPRFFASSSDRIIHFEKEYNYAPFTFQLDTPHLKAFRGEDFTLQLSLAGGALPEAVYIVHNKAKFKMLPEDADTYSYTFKNVQRPVNFKFEAAGYSSSEYKIVVAERPSLLSFDVMLQYPAYLGKPAEQLSNVGNLTIPEGTTISWEFKTNATNEMAMLFEGDDKTYNVSSKLLGGYQLSRNIRRSGNYEIKLKNDESSNREKISYYLNVVSDKHPTLTLENYQ